MANTIVGIDLGSYAVKFTSIEAGFRQQRLLESFAEPVEPGESPLLERQGEALRRGLERLPQESTLFVAVPGELLTLRVLDLPFADPRKIDQVVGYELEGQIVHALSDVVYDHAVLRTPGVDGTAVLIAAARLDDIGGLLADLAAAGVDPRALYAAPLTYGTLLDDGARLADEGSVLACRVVLDIGHTRTNVCVVQGSEVVFARTILRGGAAITAAIARAYRCDDAAAEQIKHTRSLVGSEAQPAETPEARHLDGVIKEAMAPLMRDLRQTLASARTRVRVPVEAILLTGGTAQLAGLADYLAEDLGSPVIFWEGRRGSPVLPLVDETTASDLDLEIEKPETRFALASAIGWGAVKGGRQIDLRRGPFVYKASLSILRQKATHLGTLVAALVVCIILDVTMAFTRLRGEREQLQAQLKAQTQELFGEPRLDGHEVATLLRKSFKDEMAPIPRVTSYDLLGEISRVVPPNDDIKLDILELDIKPKKVFIRGTVGTAAAVDTLQSKLRLIDCFEEPVKGGISEVSGGARSFSLTIGTKC